MTYVSESSFTATGVIFSALAIIASIARAAGWRRSSLKLELDDILIIPALFFTLAIGAQLQIIGGHSLPAITPTQQYQLGKYEYAFWIVHVLAVLSIKLALLFLFRRIFRGNIYAILQELTPPSA
ncbi:hypothetical protein GGS24DRAFT_496905 [Hypoxylon argillaceum]|nr:hypothetical protein GGS24DRAFT_496905 [Hypoxylon argillaceum]